MGLLSGTQKTMIDLDQQEMRLIAKAGALAISREPKGSSPTGGPTGAVVYQGHLVTL